MADPLSSIPPNTEKTVTPPLPVSVGGGETHSPSVSSGSTPNQSSSEKIPLRTVETPEKPSSILWRLRTLQSDLATGVGSGIVTMSKIVTGNAAAKADEASMRPVQQTPYIRAFVIGLGSVGVVGLGLFLFYIAWTRSPVPLPPSERAPVVIATDSDKHLILPLEDDARRATARIAYLRSTEETQIGSIVGLYFYGGTSTAPYGSIDFLERVGTRAPSSLLRTFQNDFSAGIHVAGANEFFLVFKVDDYEQAFAGMLMWEETLIDDVGDLFRPLREFGEGAVDAVTAPLTFEDVVYRNKDIRAVRNTTGDLLLLWGFTDQRTLVLTGNPLTFAEILARVLRAGGGN